MINYRHRPNVSVLLHWIAHFQILKYLLREGINEVAGDIFMDKYPLD
jgi:hypothetical protein